MELLSQKNANALAAAVVVLPGAQTAYMFFVANIPLMQGAIAAVATVGVVLTTGVYGVVVTARYYEGPDLVEDRREIALDHDPSSFSIETEDAGDKTLVAVWDSAFNADNPTGFYTERDAVELAETILEEVEADSEREVLEA